MMKGGIMKKNAQNDLKVVIGALIGFTLVFILLFT
jgi:hypothetical protein